MKQLLIGCILTISLFGCTTTVKTDQEMGKATSQTGQVATGTLENNITTMAKYEAPSLENGNVVATIKTNNGTMTLKLFVDQVPETTTNFIGLAKKGYYNDITFHRVIPDFMIQGGDPDGTGAGGESIYGEKFNDEFHPDLKNSRGTISMANAGPNTNGSQFFINVKDNNFLDNKHSVFGQVVEGIEIADKISKAKTVANDKPEKEIKMIDVAIQQYMDGKLIDYDFDLDAKLKEMADKEALKAEQNKTRVVTAQDSVSVHYKGTLEDGSTFDSSYDRNTPIDVVISGGQVIPGFGNALVGMKMGEKKSITLAAADAYGEYDETKTLDVPRADIQGEGTEEMVVGGMLQSMNGPVKILKLTEETVTIDVNHPLAGKTLNFDLELVDFLN